MIAIRSASRIASSKSWVMKTMVLCRAACSRRNSFCISRRISGSSAENGSSRNQTSGPTASDRAIPTRCCCPPESSRGRLPSRPLSPTSSIISRARRSRSARADALHLERKGDVPQHREMRQQREVLEHHPHPVAPDLDQLPVRDPAQVAPLEAHLPRARLDQPRQASHQRRLARARQPHDHEDLARPHREARVDHRRDEARGGDLLGRGRRGRRARKASAPGPNSFQRPRQAIFGSAASIACPQVTGRSRPTSAPRWRPSRRRPPPRRSARRGRRRRSCRPSPRCRR